MAEYILGFRSLAQLLGQKVVGEPLEDERCDPATGDALQATTRGLMVWRKADNCTAFTDGYRTWIWNEHGLLDRDNTTRFPWEPDYQPPATDYQPKAVKVPIGNENYLFLKMPAGFLFHGTRSGVAQSAEAEWQGTVGYAARGADGIDSWNYTVGPNLVAVHLAPDRWGWHARACSGRYISLEFAQSTAGQGIDDDTVNAACWCIQEGRKVWPTVPLHFPTHAEVEHYGETGKIDGKSDVYPYGSPEAEELRSRIKARLAELGIM